MANNRVQSLLKHSPSGMQSRSKSSVISPDWRMQHRAPPRLFCTVSCSISENGYRIQLVFDVGNCFFPAVLFSGVGRLFQSVSILLRPRDALRVHDCPHLPRYMVEKKRVPVWCVAAAPMVTSALSFTELKCFVFFVSRSTNFS